MPVSRYEETHMGDVGLIAVTLAVRAFSGGLFANKNACMRTVQMPVLLSPWQLSYLMPRRGCSWSC